MSIEKIMLTLFLTLSLLPQQTITTDIPAESQTPAGESVVQIESETAIDYHDPYAVADFLIDTSIKGEEAVYRTDIPYSDMSVFFQNVRRIAFCLAPGYSPKTHAYVTQSRRDGDASMTKIRYTIDPADDLSDLAADPRIVAEIQKVNGLATFEEKVTEIYWFTRNAAEYDKEYAANPKDPYHSSTTALGCLNGLAICQGYSNLAGYLFDAVGIQNIKVYSIVEEKNSHIFNAVKADDGAIYAVDATTKTKTPLCMMDLETYTQLSSSKLVVDVARIFELKYPENQS